MTVSFDWMSWSVLGLVVDYAIKIVALGYVPEGRRPSSSAAWLLAIFLLPFIGLPLFLLVGSPYINRRRDRIHQEAHAMIEDVQSEVPDVPPKAELTAPATATIRMIRRLTNLPAVAGFNRGLYTDYRATIARMAAAIDEAERYVHVQIYVTAWDETTDPFFRALERAVARGVTVRLLFDHIGSRKYPGFKKLGSRLTDIGVEWHMMLPLKPFKGRFRRPDLRNHRKLVLIDGHVGFIGSLNMIDRGYLLRRHRRHERQWVDAMVEIAGPIVDSMEMVFAVDWYLESGETLFPTAHRHPQAVPAAERDALSTVQVVPSGPGYTTEPHLRVANALIQQARHRVVICSPYFIPDESLLESVTSACYRGVRVELLVSERADSFMVHHAQSSYYQALLEAGVRIYQFPEPYVLHTKLMLVDPGPVGETALSQRDSAAARPDPAEPCRPIGLIGSANMDMRSFSLNYEVSLLVAEGGLIDELTDLTRSYVAVSPELTMATWSERTIARRYLDNVMRLVSALM